MRDRLACCQSMPNELVKRGRTTAAAHLSVFSILHVGVNRALFFELLADYPRIILVIPLVSACRSSNFLYSRWFSFFLLHGAMCSRAALRVVDSSVHGGWPACTTWLEYGCYGVGHARGIWKTAG